MKGIIDSLLGLLRMTINRDKAPRPDNLLVDPGVGVGLPGVDALGEPKSDLLLGGLDGIRSVADVASHVDAEVATDSARGRVSRVGGTKHDTASLDGVEALPHHAAHRARQHVLDESREELLASQVGVVLLQVLLSRGSQLHGLQLEALGLEASDDIANKAALDAIRLDHDVSTLHSGESAHIYCRSRSGRDMRRGKITALVGPCALEKIVAAKCFQQAQMDDADILEGTFQKDLGDELFCKPSQRSSSPDTVHLPL
jgi:hypothetical protein